MVICDSACKTLSAHPSTANTLQVIYFKYPTSTYFLARELKSICLNSQAEHFKSLCKIQSVFMSNIYQETLLFSDYCYSSCFIGMPI